MRIANIRPNGCVNQVKLVFVHHGIIDLSVNSGYIYTMKIILSSTFVALALGLAWATAGSPAGDAPNAAQIIEVSDGTIQPNGTFTVLTYDAPRELHMGATGLKEAGLAAGDIVLKSDEIRIYENREAIHAAPLARIWINRRENGQYWFHTGGSGSAEHFVIPKGATVIVWTRASTEAVSWTNVFD